MAQIPFSTNSEQTCVQSLRKAQLVNPYVSVNATELKQAYQNEMQCSNSIRNSSTFCLLTPIQSGTQHKNINQLQNDVCLQQTSQNDETLQQQQQFEPSHENAEDQFTETNLIQQEMVEHSCSCSNKVVTPTLNPSPNEQLFEALESAVLQTQFLDKLKAVQSQEDDFVFLESEMEADYIMIGQYEVIQAMSMYIAEYLYTLPEAKKMCPEDLHMALRKAFQELKKNHWKAVWNLGSNLYKGVQFACGTALMLENPWLVRALGVFLWIFAKLLWYVPFALV